MEISNKQLENRLHQLLTGLGMKNEVVSTTVYNPTTKVAHTEARNQYKKIMKLFKTLSYDDKLRELLALEIRIQAEDQMKLLKAEQAASTTVDATQSTEVTEDAPSQE